MSVLLIVLFIFYIGLMVVAARRNLFELQTPLRTLDIDIENRMKDADPTLRPIGRDQFEKFKSTLSRTTNVTTALLAAAITDAFFILVGAWANFGSKATMLCAIGIIVGFIYYFIVKGKQKKQLYIKNREKFKMQLGYVLDAESKSIDYIYKKGNGWYRKGTADFHKVLIGIIGKEGTPEAYLVDMDHFTFQSVMKSELCDVVTYDGSFVTACYLIQKEAKK